MNRVFSTFGKVIFYAISYLPFPLLYAFSDFLRFVLQRIVRYRKKVVHENLRKSFPDKTPTELRQIANDFYKSLVDIFLESTKLASISKSEFSKRYKVVKDADFEQVFNSKKNLILVTGHYLNWEYYVLGLPLILQNHHVFGIYKPLTNLVFDNLFIHIRSRFGMEMIPMKETFRKLLKHEGKPFAIAVATDQTPSNVEQCYWGEFLNQDTPVFLGAEKMAKQFDAMVVFMDLKKPKRGYYELRFKVLFESAHDTQENEITRSHVAYLEEQIRKVPAPWLWSHKRWKHRRREMGDMRFETRNK